MAEKVKKRYLFPKDYMADPSVHVFDGKLKIGMPAGTQRFGLSVEGDVVDIEAVVTLCAVKDRSSSWTRTSTR